MSIIENSILHVSTLLFFLLGLGGLLLGYIKQNHLFYNWAFGALILGCLQSAFIGVVIGDTFVLANASNYEANYIFTASNGLILIISIWAIIVFYRHKAVPLILVQLGLAVSALIVVVTFATSAKEKFGNKIGRKAEETRFIQAEEFQKGSQKPSLSKTSSAADSVPKQ